MLFFIFEYHRRATLIGTYRKSSRLGKKYNKIRCGDEICSHPVEWEFGTMILSFDNVSCSLSDTWFAKKRTNIFFTRPTKYFFFLLIWRFYDFWFFRSKLGPLRNMRRKNPSRFPIPVKVGLKEANAAFASFALSFVQIGKREGFFRRMFRGGPLRS